VDQIKLKGNSALHGDIIGIKHEYNIQKKTKLTLLFEKLNEEFNSDDKVSHVIDDLQKYQDSRDRISLEDKLKDGDRLYLLDDALWLKQQYTKKLTKFQFYESAQEIHAFLLGVVLEKFRNVIKPMIIIGRNEEEISRCLSDNVISPILKIIQDQGCYDMMGLSSDDIEGMVYYLAGKCHINWKL